MYKHERVFYVLGGILMLVTAYSLSHRINSAAPAGVVWFHLIVNIALPGAAMLYFGLAKNKWLQKWRQESLLARRSLLSLW